MLRKERGSHRGSLRRRYGLVEEHSTTAKPSFFPSVSKKDVTVPLNREILEPRRQKIRNPALNNFGGSSARKKTSRCFPKTLAGANGYLLRRGPLIFDIS